MKTFHLTLSLAAALFAMPALAQADQAPQKRPIRFEIGDVDADFGLALLSLDDGTLPFQGQWVLCNATMLLLGMEPIEGTLAAVTDLPVKWSADLYWQGVTYGAKQGLRIHPVQRFTPAAGKIDEDCAPVGQIYGMPGLANGNEPKKRNVVAGSLPDQKPAPIVQLEPIGLKLVPAEDGTMGSQLLARFVAPTSDYGLALIRVEAISADGIVHSSDNGAGEGGTRDVYLYRKSPGPGEGMLDIVEEHRLTVELSGAKVVRVFLAEGTTSRPGPAVAWKLLATL